MGYPARRALENMMKQTSAITVTRKYSAAQDLGADYIYRNRRLCSDVLHYLWKFPDAIPIWLTCSNRPIKGAIKFEIDEQGWRGDAQWRQVGQRWQSDRAHSLYKPVFNWLKRVFQMRESIVLWVYLEYEE